MKKSITAFYVESVLLVAAFTAVLLILSAVFGYARAESRAARRLNSAVCLAENAAEAFAAAPSGEGLLRLLDEGNAALTETADGAVFTARYGADRTPSPTGELVVTVRVGAPGGEDGAIRGEIDVADAASGETVYHLTTAARGGAS